MTLVFRGGPVSTYKASQSSSWTSRSWIGLPHFGAVTVFTIGQLRPLTLPAGAHCQLHVNLRGVDGPVVGDQVGVIGHPVHVEHHDGELHVDDVVVPLFVTDLKERKTFISDRRISTCCTRHRLFKISINTFLTSLWPFSLRSFPWPIFSCWLHPPLQLHPGQFLAWPHLPLWWRARCSLLISERACAADGGSNQSLRFGCCSGAARSICFTADRRRLNTYAACQCVHLFLKHWRGTVKRIYGASRGQ